MSGAFDDRDPASRVSHETQATSSVSRSHLTDMPRQQRERTVTFSGTEDEAPISGGCVPRSAFRHHSTIEGIVMNIKQILVLSTLSVAAVAALADTTAPLTRAEVRQSVLTARAAGQLIPAGEGEARLSAISAAPSTLTRADVRADVLVARADGELCPAGEGGDEPQFKSNLAATPQLARADVKAEVLAARKAGELIPAGENEEGDYRPVAQAKAPKFVTAMRAEIAHAFASR